MRQRELFKKVLTQIQPILISTPNVESGLYIYRKATFEMAVKTIGLNLPLIKAAIDLKNNAAEIAIQ